MQSYHSMAKPKTPKSISNWFAGLVVMVATVVAYVGFARVSVGWTLGISSIIFVALTFFLWRVGVAKEAERRGGQ